MPAHAASSLSEGAVTKDDGKARASICGPQNLQVSEIPVATLHGTDSVWGASEGRCFAANPGHEGYMAMI